MTTQVPSFLPLTEPTFFILLSLAPGQKHGYAILKDVEELSRGRVILSTSTLYTALARLLEQNLIERAENRTEDRSAPGLPRKAYRLTGLGQRALTAEMDRLQTLVATAQLRLGEGGL